MRPVFERGRAAYRNYRYGYSLCYMVPHADYLFHRWLPWRLDRSRLLPRLAARLERTSPRWGWQSRQRSETRAAA